MTATATKTDIVQAPATERLERIPLGELHDSPLNPRKFYDPTRIQELKNNLLHAGQTTPLIVRPGKSGGYEIAAGHRRKKACLLAMAENQKGAVYRRLDQPLCVVRDMDERAFLITLNVENLQRADLRALEEAQGFEDLIKRASLDIEQIAGQTGKSPEYVYGRIKLLQLVPEAKELLNSEVITAGHAILIARETHADQRKIIGKKEAWSGWYTGGLFEEDKGDAELALGDKRKARSVRELATYIQDHIRQKPETVDQFLLPDAAMAIKTAVEQEEKVVHITRDHRPSDDARDDKNKTYGVDWWKRADGKAKTCDYAVLGVVVVGPGRGDAFKVCVSKDSCAVHWADRVRKAKAAKERARKRAHASVKVEDPSKARAKEAKEQARLKAEEEKRRAVEQAEELETKRKAKARPAILAAIAATVKKDSVTAASAVGKYFVELANQEIIRHNAKPAHKLVPAGRSAAELIRWVVFSDLYSQLDWGDQEIGDVAKDFGVDWQAILEKEAPAPKPEKKLVQTSAKKPAKKKGKRKGKKK